jgi:hypothetical protein
MNVLLAHHLEAHHVPILVTLFAAGLYIGWQAISRWLTRAPRPVTGQPGDPGLDARRP